jgi:hypothetical protein
VRELTFISVSEDGSTLLLGSTDGAQFSVPLDERLQSAIRRDRSGHRAPVILEGASPRDIQNRIRHGQSPEDIEATTGLELERILRFAGPVLAERAHVADQAKEVSLRDTGHERTLNAIVTDALTLGGADLDGVEWDAWRRDDTHWSVLVSWEPVDLVAEGATAALFSFEPTDRTIESDDPASAWLLGESADNDESLPLDTVAHLSGRPMLVAVPANDDVWDDDSIDVDLSETAIIARDEALMVDFTDLADGPPGEPVDEAPLDDVYNTLPGLEVPQKTSRRTPQRQPRSTGGDAQKSGRSRASVPSWDEILFGKGQPDK